MATQLPVPVGAPTIAISTRAEQDLIRIHAPFHERCDGGDDLVGRTGRVHPLGGPALHRMPRIPDYLAPPFTGQAHGKFVGVKGRPADHGKDLTGFDVHEDTGTPLVPQFQLQSFLKANVQCQSEVGPRCRFGSPQHIKFPSPGVHLDLPSTVFSTQVAVVGFFQGVLTDHIAFPRPGIFSGVELFPGYLPDISEDVRGDLPMRVVPARNHHKEGSGEPVLVNLEQSHLFRTKVLENFHSAVRCMGGVPFKPLNGLSTIPSKKVGQGYYYSLPVLGHIFRDKGESVFRTAVCQDHTVAVGEDTPCRRHVDEPYPVVVSKPLIKGVVQDLKPPEIQ